LVSRSSRVERYGFSGHETFPFRYSWLPKGVWYLRDRPELFSTDEALVVLGVGKNMVKSIRFWLETLELIRRVPEDLSLRLEATELGNSLLAPDGWDPFLEDPGTLWLLHWHLVRKLSPASTWYLAFTVWTEETFDRNRLVQWLWELARDAGSPGTESSLKRDVEVFMRTYVPAKTKRDLALEDTFDCPLVDLGLIDEEATAFRFVRGLKPTLPDLVFVYALLDFWDRNFSDQGTLSFERVLYGPGSPGSAFKLTENALAERLESLPSWSGIGFDDTSGMRTLLRQDADVEQVDNLPMSVLERYYDLGTRGKEVASV
jgi:hypothetical protein